MNFEFKSTPFKHQFDEWLLSREAEARGIFWEQGCGKSKLVLDTAAWLYLTNKINGMLIVAPNGVHRNWVEDEVPNHLIDKVAAKTHAMYFQASKASTKRHKLEVQRTIQHNGFAIITISYEAFMTKEGKASMIEFFDKRKLLYVLDEAHYIKSPDANRTKSILKSAKYAPYRRILTGTPIGQGPFDLFSQIKFLEEKFWRVHGLDNFTAYKAHFGIFEKTIWNPTAYNPKTGQRSGNYIDSCVGYRRIPQLKEMIAGITSRVTKDKVLDLPAKLYQKRYFEMTDEQIKLYKAIRDEFVAYVVTAGNELIVNATDDAAENCKTCLGAREVQIEDYTYPCPDCYDPYSAEGGTAVFAELAITRMLRLQQITCGYLPTEDDEEPVHVILGQNRRLDTLMDIIEETGHKVIVWARFQLDISLILQELKNRGIKGVRYDGLVSDEDRAEAKYLFKGERPVYNSAGSFIGKEAIPENEQARVFVANPAAGSTGLTLTEAKVVVYYSNSFKLVDRLQSEDRAHRIGQTNNVVYIDIIAEDSIDKKIVGALKSKHNVAQAVLGDEDKGWI